MALGGDLLQIVEELGHRRSGGIDGEERHFQTVVVGVLGGLHRGFYRLLDRPPVRLLDEVMAGRYLHHDAADPAVEGELDVRDHASAEGIDLGGETLGHHSLYGIGIGGGDGGKTCFDAMDAGLGQGGCDPHLVVRGELDPGLLFPVAEGHIVNLDIRRDREPLGHLWQVIPGTREPEVGLPRLSVHFTAPHPFDRTILHHIRSMIEQSKQDLSG